MQANTNAVPASLLALTPAKGAVYNGGRTAFNQAQWQAISGLLAKGPQPAQALAQAMLANGPAQAPHHAMQHLKYLVRTGVLAAKAPPKAPAKGK